MYDITSLAPVYEVAKPAEVLANPTYYAYGTDLLACTDTSSINWVFPA